MRFPFVETVKGQSKMRDIPITQRRRIVAVDKDAAESFKVCHACDCMPTPIK